MVRWSHIIASKAVCLGEALQDSFKVYQQKILDNAQALAQSLLANGMNLVSGGTDNHLMLLDLRGTGVTGKELGTPVGRGSYYSQQKRDSQ